MNNSNSIYNNISQKFPFLNDDKRKHEYSLFRKITNDNEKVNNLSKTTINTILENNNKESKLFQLYISNLIFGKKLYSFFKNQFFNNNNFIESLEFILSNSFYRYIKIMKLNKKNSKKKLKLEEIQKLIDIEGNIFSEIQNINKKINLKENSNFEKEILEKYYIEKLFEDITRILEIRTNEGICKTIIYTKLPLMKFLSKESKIEFNQNVNRDNETSKKYDLIRHIDYFLKEINYYKKYKNKWNFWLLNIDFYYLNLLMK